MSAQTNEEMVPSVPVEQPKTLEKLTIAEPNKPMKIKAEEESKSQTAITVNNQRVPAQVNNFMTESKSAPK